MVNNFSFAATPNIVFGSGRIKYLPKYLERLGSKILLITGKSSFIHSDHWDQLLLQFEGAKIEWSHFAVETEPTPDMIDHCVSMHNQNQLDAVVSIGGGSVMDAGKAISAMLCQKGSIRDYLEAMGTKQPSGAKIPFVAIPTTSGTGSETTKNAVISEVGENGFKKSLRHDNYVPDLSIIDPELTINCPVEVTAYSGMDAFTQLLESYLSTHGNPMTDALAVDGMRKIRDSLETAVENGFNLEAREQMAYAAMISGITLANAGLGTVHGFASSIGGFFDVPHGLVCARMMLPVNQLTIEKLKNESPNDPGLYKYARVGKLFSKDKSLSDDEYISIILNVIEVYSRKFDLPGLKKFGLKEEDFAKIIKVTGNKYNSIALTTDELKRALDRAI